MRRMKYIFMILLLSISGFSMDDAQEMELAGKNKQDKIFDAIHNDDIETLRQLIGEASTKFLDDPADTDLPYILFAASEANHEAIRLLIKKGVNVNAVSKKIGSSALHLLAARNCNDDANQVLECAHQILQSGALLDIVDDEHNTPLLKCVQWNNVAMAKALLAEGKKREDAGQTCDQKLEKAFELATVDLESPKSHELINLLQSFSSSNKTTINKAGLSLPDKNRSYCFKDGLISLCVVSTIACVVIIFLLVAIVPPLVICVSLGDDCISKVNNTSTS